MNIFYIFFYGILASVVLICMVIIFQFATQQKKKTWQCNSDDKTDAKLSRRIAKRAYSFVGKWQGKNHGKPADRYHKRSLLNFHHDPRNFVRM